jgi:DNA-binding response OmpR family regulator
MRPGDTKRILIVEDDEIQAELLQRHIEARSEYQVGVEHRGDTAVERILAEQPDLVILDLMLPGLDSWAVCEQIRPRFAGPILLLTGQGSDQSLIQGLALGADSCLTKPASPDLILSKVAALLRRAAMPALGDGRARATESSNGPDELIIDPGRRSVTLSGRSVALSTIEYNLLWHLAEHAGDAVSRDTLHRAIRGRGWDGVDRSVDLMVLRLRRKLGDSGSNPRLIKTVRGVGYQLCR